MLLAHWNSVWQEGCLDTGVGASVSWCAALEDLLFVIIGLVINVVESARSQKEKTFRGE